MMIDMKQAVQVAQDYCRNLYGPDQLADFVLEEVELTEDEKFWLITIGFSLKIGEAGRAQATSGNVTSSQTRPADRVYKIMRVDASNGRPLSLKIKKL